MVELSENARKSLDDYLRQVRSYLRWSKSLDPSEVEQNINEHIERELEGAPEPVSSSALDVVLTRLGSPRQWVPPEALNWWGKLVLKLRTDSEDWRLAYISFALLVMGCLFLFVSPFQVVFLAASFLTARAALAVAGSEDLGAQKWLLYPALLVVGAACVLTLFAGPALVGGAMASEERRIQWIPRDMNLGVTAFVTSAMVLVTGLWWMLLGLLACKWPGLIRHPLRPFADGFNHRHALAISGAGLLLFVLLAGFIAIYMNLR
jgi:hypothetical protein